MKKRRGEVYFLILLIFVPSVIHLNHLTEASKKYTIEANQTLTLTLFESARSLFLIEVDSSYTSLSYDFEFRNSSNHIIISKANIGSQYTTGYVGYGEYRIRFINDNNEILVLKIETETYILETNNEIDGYSYKNELFCWFFNTDEIVDLKQFPIQSLKKRNYFLTFITLGEIADGNLWLSYYNPQQYSEWSSFLTPMSFDGNLKVETETDRTTNWLVVDVTSIEDVEVIIVLTLRGLNVVGKFFIGLFAATAGVSLFVFIYIDPLRYRKRKVNGESYDHQKQKYEQHEDLESSLKEVLTSEKSKEKIKRKKKE